MDKRHFENPYPDYNGGPVNVDQPHVCELIRNYVNGIIESTKPGSPDSDERGDLYVGNAGIAFMLWKMSRSDHVKDMIPALSLAEEYINDGKKHAAQYKKRTDERCAFLCGNAGLYAVSAAISNDLGKKDVLEDDLKNFSAGFEVCQTVFSKHGCDEVLVGRAGFLSGCYWLRDVISPKPFSEEEILAVCESCVKSGRKYAHSTKAPLPLMYQYHGTEYLGAAHGLCAILHMLLDSPWFGPNSGISPTKLDDIRKSIDFFVGLQDQEGNFPVALEDLQTGGREKRLVHWCHGAPGAIYLLVKAHLIFKDPKYLEAATRCADLIWKKGLLKKGPGICHGVSGNGYAFLLMYRLTSDSKYLYRASKFMEFLTHKDFKSKARIPDRPFSLYEGIAGTVCFLIDLLEPSKAAFPFMDVFH